MVRRLGLVAAWTLATVVSVSIAAQAVGGVRDRVTDRPADLSEVAAIAAAATATTAPEDVGASATSAPAGATAIASTATTAAAVTDPEPAQQAPPATSSAPAGPTTAAPVPPADAGAPSPSTISTSTSTTAPTTSEAPLEYGHYDLTGGSVDVSYRPGEVFLVGATPNPGYRVSVSSSGPVRVEVEFEPLDESDPYEGEFEAEWKSGQLDVEIDERFEESDG